ncbi:hypothetical protein, partial [Mesorhizobium sp.]|uniref:hypothetical protein n=1 Tax=Mesorhizobium sp. TaxID=1871066 RepID=UPI0025BBE318
GPAGFEPPLRGPRGDFLSSSITLLVLPATAPRALSDAQRRQCHLDFAHPAARQKPIPVFRVSR